LGQIIIILNAICRDFSHLDKPANARTKSMAKSHDSRPKTPASELSGGIKSEEKYERQLLTATNIQNFLFNYIGEKLKTEKL